MQSRNVMSLILYRFDIIPVKMYFQTMMVQVGILCMLVRTKFKHKVSIWQCKLVGREVG